MFSKVGWIVTWLLGPLAAVAAGGVLNAFGQGDIHLTDLLAAATLLLWLCLAWAVARLQVGRIRTIYLSGCAAVVVAGVVVIALPQHPAKTAADNDVVDVSIVRPQKH